MKKIKWILFIIIIGYGVMNFKEIRGLEKLVSTITHQIQNGIEKEKTEQEQKTENMQIQQEAETESVQNPEQGTEQNQEQNIETEYNSEPEISAEEKNTSENKTQAFKEAMDSYEKFFDEYIEFMNKYSNSDNTIEMLADYSAYMLTYAETMEKLDEIDTEELTEEELAYYIDTMARIQKKLLQATGNE